MAYNLPPAWDPGYALPKSVRDEGLERRAFVTKPLPPGTYDDVRTGTGGYVVPQYVMAERTGRGTFTTKEAPQNTYVGKRIPNWLNQRPQVASQVRRGDALQTTFAGALGGIAGVEATLHPVFSDYGARAARLLMSQAMARPEPQRKAFLKGILDRIDPTIWTRAADLARTYNRQGMPVSAAVERGIGQAMGAGLAKEIVDTGVRGSVKRRSLLGLGCSVALGDVMPSKAGTSTTGMTCQTGAGNPVPGYTWSTDGGTGHWARVPVGGVPQPNPVAGCYTLTSVVHPAGETVRPLAPAPSSAQMLQVGPFVIPADAASFSMGATVRDNRTPPGAVWAAAITPEWKTKIGNAIVTQWQLSQHPQGGNISSGDPWSGIFDSTLVPASDLGITVPPLLAPIAAELARLKTFGATDPYSTVAPGTPIGLDPRFTRGGFVPLGFFRSSVQGRPTPLLRAKHPVSGEDYGIYLQQSPITGGGWVAHSYENGSDHAYPADQTLRLDVNSDGKFLHIGGPLTFIWRKIPPAERDILQHIWDVITEVGAALIHAADVVLGVVGSMVCDVLGNPLATAGAVVAAAGSGAPPQAGAAGVNLAQGVCKGGQPPPFIQPTSSSILPVALLAGGAIALTLLLSKKKTKVHP